MDNLFQAELLPVATVVANNVVLVVIVVVFINLLFSSL